MINYPDIFIFLAKLADLMPLVTVNEVTAFGLVVSLLLFIAFERTAPKLKFSKQFLLRSYVTNISLFMVNSLVMSLLSATSLWFVAKQHLTQGVLSAMPNNAWKMVISLLAFDFLLYLWHRACHLYDGLWVFHKVHHNDPYLNVTTGFRVHIAEVLMTFILKMLLIIAVGIDESIVFFHELMTTFFIMFHHTNSSFMGEKWLSYVITTPTLHRTHHSEERQEHDSNYGAILSLWDRLFNTLLEHEPQTIGIKGYSPQTLVGLIKFGFGYHPTPVALPENIDLLIAEAAYYKAEKRGFAVGYEWDDWLEAKQDILSRFYSERRKVEHPVLLFKRYLAKKIRKLYSSFMFWPQQILKFF